MFYTPLEQFKIFVIVPVSYFWMDFSITNATVYTIIVGAIIYLLLVGAVKERKLIGGVVQSMSEALFLFVHDIIKQQAGYKGLRYMSALLVVFYMIMFFNLIGLLPYSFTCTSQVCYTFTLGFSMFIGIVIIGVVEQRAKFVKQFVPQTSGPILPLLVVIEIFSYGIRPFSLSIRLFANMLAGHTLMNILGSFAISLMKHEIFLGVLMGLPIIAVSVLEIGIALLQAYVFFVLLAIYLKESVQGH